MEDNEKLKKQNQALQEELEKKENTSKDSSVEHTQPFIPNKQ